MRNLTFPKIYSEINPLQILKIKRYNQIHWSYNCMDMQQVIYIGM